MTKPVYDLMVCHDGATRAVPVINGIKIDPSLPNKDKKKKEEKNVKPKISIQDRLQNKVEDFISAVEGQADVARS